MPIRIFLTIFLLSHLGPFVFLPGSSQGAKKNMIKFATVVPEGSTWMKNMRVLDKRLRKKSDGKIGFRIYAGGVAGDELDVLRKIRIGQIHSAAFSGVGFGQILPMVRILDLPFLFRNEQETDLVHRKMEPFFSEKWVPGGKPSWPGEGLSWQL